MLHLGIWLLDQTRGPASLTPVQGKTTGGENIKSAHISRCASLCPLFLSVNSMISERRPHKNDPTGTSPRGTNLILTTQTNLSKATVSRSVGPLQQISFILKRGGTGKNIRARHLFTPQCMGTRIRENRLLRC